MVQRDARAIHSGMRNPWADEFEQAHRTPACAGGAHDNCPHLYGFGVSMNPRRLRLEHGAGLCKCDCHSSCPVTSTRITTTPQTWRQSCTCPGAQAERIRNDQAGVQFPDLDELKQQLATAQQESLAHQDAFRVTRAGAAGKSREQVRDVYIAELRSRGLEIPRQEILDAHVDALTGNYLTGIRLLGRSIASLWKMRDAFRPPT